METQFTSNSESGRELSPKSELIIMCESEGHIPSERGVIVAEMGTFRVYNNCQRCHLPYVRIPTLEEIETYREIMKLVYRNP